MGNKKFDINEAYDYFCANCGTYVLCFDIRGLDAVNRNHGRDVGDAVILEVMHRLNDAADDTAVLRIGGDEFLLFTQSGSADKARETAEKMLSRNGDKITVGGADYPVSVWCGAVVIKKPLRYTAFLADYDKAIDQSRQSDGLCFIE